MAPNDLEHAVLYAMTNARFSEEPNNVWFEHLAAEFPQVAARLPKAQPAWVRTETAWGKHASVDVVPYLRETDDPKVRAFVDALTPELSCQTDLQEIESQMNQLKFGWTFGAQDRRDLVPDTLRGATSEELQGIVNGLKEILKVAAGRTGDEQKWL